MPIATINRLRRTVTTFYHRRRQIEKGLRGRPESSEVFDTRPLQTRRMDVSRSGAPQREKAAFDR